MGKNIELTATDGHKFAAYVAEPSGTPKGALILVMEIFGVNSHIRNTADESAADGYLVIAPAFFDRVQRGLDVGYTPPEIEQARGLMQKMSFGAQTRYVGLPPRLHFSRPYDENVPVSGRACVCHPLRTGGNAAAVTARSS